MKYFYDTEFLEDGKTIELISIGIVADDGREYYAVNSELPIERVRKHDWLTRNVLPHLPLQNHDRLAEYLSEPINTYPKLSIDHVRLDLRSTIVKPKWVIANEVRDFLTTKDDTELWAWFGAYDHVALAQLFGPMVRLPEGIPMYTNDVRSLVDFTGITELPKQPADAHDALVDARHVKTMHEYITMAARQ